MTRWRLKVWIPSVPAVRNEIKTNDECQWCMINKALLCADRLATAFKIPITDVKWDLMKYAGHLHEWEIHCTSQYYRTRPERQHGHRRLDAGTVRPRGGSGGVQREARAVPVSSGRRQSRKLYLVQTDRRDAEDAGQQGGHL